LSPGVVVVIQQRLEPIEQGETGAPAGETSLVDVALERGGIGSIAGRRRVTEVARYRLDRIEGAVPQIAFEKRPPLAAR
jgi:hypothetical protein